MRDADFALSGASSLTLEGRAGDLALDASGASHVDLEGFPVHDVDLQLSGTSHATVPLDGRLDGNVSGASHLIYVGKPTVGELNTSGGSTVTAG